MVINMVTKEKQVNEDGVVVSTSKNVAKDFPGIDPYEIYSRVPKKEYRSEFSPCGDKVLHENEYYIEDGEKKAKPGARIDWDAYIQASAKSCDLTTIVEKYLAGDTTVVNVSAGGITGDFASMPRSINEINDLAERSKSGFNNLSPEIKAIFNNSFEDFYNAVLSNQVENKINAYAVAKAEAARKAAEDAKKAAEAQAAAEGDKK